MAKRRLRTANKTAKRDSMTCDGCHECGYCGTINWIIAVILIVLSWLYISINWVKWSIIVLAVLLVLKRWLPNKWHR